MPDDLNIDYKKLTKLDINEFTSNVTKDDILNIVTGSGIFDTLMDTATQHILAQFEGNRIRNEDYADAYVTIYQATLQICADLWKAKTFEKINILKGLAEIDQIRAQEELTLAEAANAKLVPELTKAQIELAYAQIEAEKERTKYQRAQINLINAQIEEAQQRPALVNAQTVQTLAQTEYAKAQTKAQELQPALIAAQTDNMLAQAATEKQRPALINAQTVYTLAQAESEKYRLALVEAQIKLAEAQAALETAKLPLMEAQIELAQEQVELAKEQARSELAKRDLYRRQIEGFDEDYKQKILKIMMDSWAVGFSVAKDSFEASGIPAPMQKATIDDLYNDYILTDLDDYSYVRTEDVLQGFNDN